MTMSVRKHVFALAYTLVLAAPLHLAAQQVQHYDFSLVLNDTTNRIVGRAALTVSFAGQASRLSVDLAGPGIRDSGMTVSAVSEGRKAIPFVQDKQGLTLSVKASAGSSHTYTIRYAGIPKDGLIISTNKFGKRTFFGDNWPNRAHQWLPCIDRPSDKASVDFTVTAPDHYQVVANGLQTAAVELPRHLRRTHWKEKIPLPTKVMVIGVADFAIDHPADVQGIPIYTYVFPDNKVEGFKDYAVAASILPFYIRMIGPYAYEKLANIQSKTIFGGMENASAIFYFENSVGSRGMEELMAHEIAHQWFGDAVTETDFRHLWLSEGFATYMTHLYMEHTYGTDTLRKGMAADRKRVIAFDRRRLTPVVDSTASGNYMQLLNANSYQKGGWVLHMLRRQLGDSLFWKGIASYFARYDGRNASTEDFRGVMEEVSGKDLKPFVQQWLYTPGVPQLQVSWSYDSARSEVVLQIEQEQATLFSFPLEYSFGPGQQVYQADIHDKLTLVRQAYATAPDSVYIDPGVSLLADFSVKRSQ
jgi:aminopeptidase N